MKKLLFFLFSFAMLLIAAASCNNSDKQAPPPPIENVQVIGQVTPANVQALVFYAQDVEAPPLDAEITENAKVFDFFKGNWATIATILFLLSELLAQTKLKSNSIFQLIQNWLKSAAGKR